MRRIFSSERNVLMLVAVAALLSHALLLGTLRPFNLDDTWFLSFARSWVEKGIDTDTVFGGTPLTGMGGVVLFGKIYANVYGTALGIIGWTKNGAYLVSFMLLLMSAMIWRSVLVRMGYRPFMAALFGVSLLLTEATLGAAQQARPEALILLFAAVSIWMMQQGWVELSLCTALLAVEVHPVGASALVGIVAYLLTQERPPRLLFRTIAGIMGGVAIYLHLHGDALSLLPLLTQGHGLAEGNFLFAYFFLTKYFRHLPELLLLAVALWVLLSRRRDGGNFPLVYLLGMLAFTAVLGRSNFHYMALVFPAVLLAVYVAAEHLGAERLLAVLLVCLYLPQYALAVKQNIRYRAQGEYHAQVRQLVPRDGTPVAGAAIDWFSFGGGTFVETCTHDRTVLEKAERFTVIQHQKYTALHRTGAEKDCAPELLALGVATEKGSFDAFGEKITVYTVTRQAK